MIFVTESNNCFEIASENWDFDLSGSHLIRPACPGYFQERNACNRTAQGVDKTRNETRAQRLLSEWST